MIVPNGEETDYTDLDSVREEVAFARKLCSKHGWPVIDVTRRSIEETAATILNHYARHAAARCPCRSAMTPPKRSRDRPTAGPAARLVLASASPSPRAWSWRTPGVSFAGASRRRVDEERGQGWRLKAEGATAAQIAETLAELKAQKVSRRHPGALVIGADQMLECEGRTGFDKPARSRAGRGASCAAPGRQDPPAHLRRLRGARRRPALASHGHEAA